MEGSARTPIDNAAAPTNSDGVGSAGSAAAPIEAPIDAGVVAPLVPAAPTDCVVDIVTAPAGVEIVDDANKVIGTAPTKLTLPCAATKLVFRKATYVSATRTVTPTAEGAKLRVGLAHQTLSVKVSSSPPGASISVDGKPKGVTPTTVKLPMLEAATITYKKDGFQSDTAKVTPRSNNQSVHVQLKKKGR